MFNLRQEPSIFKLLVTNSDDHHQCEIAAEARRQVGALGGGKKEAEAL
jgi:hypothetical protein